MAKKTSIGGQAVIEGVMMRGPKKIAVAVRKPDEEIEIDIRESIPPMKKNNFLSLPVIRGSAALIDSLTVGVKSLTYSASFFEEEESEGKFDKFIKAKLGDKADNVLMGFSLFLAIILAVGLFFVLPTFLTNLVRKAVSSSFLKNLIEGAIMLSIFLVYLYLISLMKDIQRVFQYHGAEHKSIFCYEAGLPLTPENAKQFPRFHPRCGTNFLLIVVIISILVFSFLGWKGLLIRMALKIILLPLIAGISYEIIKWLGRSESFAAKILSFPGLMLQKLTTREPDERQLEVALAALMEVLPEGEDDSW